MRKLFIISATLLASCGLNAPDKPQPVRAVAPDKLNWQMQLNEEGEYRGQGFGFSWNLD